MKTKKGQKMESSTLKQMVHSQYVGMNPEKLVDEELQLKAEWGLQQSMSLSQSGVRELENFSYLRKFEEKYGHRTEVSMNETQLENSLNEMRMLIRIIDSIANEKMDKNYKYMAAVHRQKNQPTSEKEISILQASLENNNKKYTIQNIELEQISEITKGIGNSDTILDQLDTQIKIAARQVYQLDKEVKERQVQVNKMDLLIIDKAIGEQNNQIYISYNKVKHMHDYKVNQQRRMGERQEYLDQRKEDYTYRIQQIQQKLTESIKLAEKKRLEVSTNKQFLNLKQKYLDLKQQKVSQQRKLSLADKNNKHTEFGLLKIISDYRQKLQEIDNKIRSYQGTNTGVQNSIEQLVRKNQISEAYIKSMNNRYAETLNNSLPKQEAKPIRASSIFKIDKPNFRNRLASRVTKSVDKDHIQINLSQLSVQSNSVQSKPQIQSAKLQLPTSKQKVIQKNLIEDQIFDFDQNPKETKIKKPFRIGKSATKNLQESLNQIEDHTQLLFQDSKRPGTRSQNINLKRPHSRESRGTVSKPLLNLKKDKLEVSTNIISNSQRVNAEPIEQMLNIKPSRFARLGQRRLADKKISEQQMRALEKKGRQILGI